MISFTGHSLRKWKCSIITITVIILVIFQYFFYVKIYRGAYELKCSYLSIITDTRMIFDHASYSIEHYPEFICPQNFRNMADWVYGWPENIFDEDVQNSDHRIRATVASLPHGSILYIKTDSLPTFFSTIYPYFRNKFVLITGQGDLQAPSEYLQYLEDKHSKIIHWFGQNGDIHASTSQRFTHIPIGKSMRNDDWTINFFLGLNCYFMAENIRKIHQQYVNYTLPSVGPHSMDQPSHYIQPFDITDKVLNTAKPLEKILLINFKPETDYTGLRSKIWKEICEQNPTSFATCFSKPDGVNASSLPSIYRRNRQYPLWLSPRGNGLDCHRTWEALYLDAIPIVWHSTLDSLYADLPIILINDWSEINEEFLRKKLSEIARKKRQQPSVYQYDKLRNAFWHRLILEKSRYASLITPTQRNRCWRANITQSNLS